MKTRNLLQFGLVGFMSAFALMGCGTNEPFAQLRDASLGPTLTLPVASSSVPVTGINPYTTASGGFEISVPILTTPIIAPEAGIVSAVDTTLDTGMVAVTIFHSSRMSTRIRRLSASTTLQVGGTLVAGQTIGTPGSTVIVYSVFVDGAVVCPMSFLNTDTRTYLYQNSRYNGIPCQI